MEELSGQELYLFERAGFVFRRSACAPSTAAEGIPEFLLRICRDILGAELRADELPVPDRIGWGRLCGSPDSKEEELARAHGVWAVASVEDDDSMIVLPGSHLYSLDQLVYSRLRTTPDCEISGQVTLRFAPGDAALLNPALLYRRAQAHFHSRLYAWFVL